MESEDDHERDDLEETDSNDGATQRTDNDSTVGDDPPQENADGGTEVEGGEDEDEAEEEEEEEDEAPIHAVAPRVVLHEEGHVEVSASPAFQCLDEVQMYTI